MDYQIKHRTLPRGLYRAKATLYTAIVTDERGEVDRKEFVVACGSGSPRALLQWLDSFGFSVIKTQVAA